MCDFFLGGSVLWKDMRDRLGVPPLALQLSLLYIERYTLKQLCSRGHATILLEDMGFVAESFGKHLATETTLLLSSMPKH